MALGTVALLFTDLVGSTELSARIGPVLSEAIRKQHFGLLRAAIDGAGGREVKNLGDGLMVAFPTTSAALDAAVAAQQAIEVRNRKAELRFEVRMGVSIGEVTEEDDDYFGEAVVQAARLCALAQGGQILVTDVARVLAGSTSHELSSVGPLELKGLPQPVLTHEVRWETATGATMPLPLRLRGAPEGGYVGRTAERAALADVWTRASTGAGTLVLLAGEPGMGKSRLATHHSFKVHEAGASVLYGAVDEGLGVPYQPWVEAIGHYVDHAPEDLLQRYVDASGPDLARLSPTLVRRLPDLPAMTSSDGETERHLLLEAVAQLLRTAAADNPVLLVLDDLHWADKPTLLMLTHLHRALAESRVLIIGTYRDSELTPEHPLTDVLANLRRLDRVERIDLTGLGDDDILQLLRGASRQDFAADGLAFAEILRRDTNGNPLFVAEVLRDMLETGRLAQDENGVWGLTTSMNHLPTPASVRDVVSQRVQRLGPDAQRILATAAVIGRDFELDLLAAVLEQPAEDLLDTMDLAMVASLLTESGARSGGLRFVHALIAQALVDGLSQLRRAQLHRQIAMTIEALHGPDLGDRVGSVATHLLAAGDDPIKTIDYSRRAGQHALDNLAPDEALRWFRTALELLEDTGLDDDELRCDLLTDSGEAMREAGQPGSREQLLAAAHLAIAQADADRCSRAVLAMGRSFAVSVGSPDEEFLATVHHALALSREPDDRRAHLLSMLGAEMMAIGRLEDRRAIADEAIDIARGLDDATLVRVLISSASALWVPGRPERRALLDEVDQMVERFSDPKIPVFAAFHRACLAVESADRPGLDDALEKLRAACSSTEMPLLLWMLNLIESYAAAVDGDLDRSAACAVDAYRHAESAAIEDSYAAFHGQIGGVELFRGRLGDVVTLVEEAVADNPTLQSMRALVGVACLQADQPDRAAEILSETLDLPRDAWVETFSSSWVIDLLATIAAAVGDQVAARDLYDLRLGTPNVIGSAGPCGLSHASTSLGMLAATLGDRTAAREHFLVADDALVAFRAPILLAYNRMEHARALVALGDPADHAQTRDLLADAAAIYGRHDCPIRVAECEALLGNLA